GRDICRADVTYIMMYSGKLCCTLYCTDMDTSLHCQNAIRDQMYCILRTRAIFYVHHSNDMSFIKQEHIIDVPNTEVIDVELALLPRSEIENIVDEYLSTIDGVEGPQGPQGPQGAHGVA